jgi:hypothetical protein
MIAFGREKTLGSLSNYHKIKDREWRAKNPEKKAAPPLIGLIKKNSGAK